MKSLFLFFAVLLGLSCTRDELVPAPADGRRSDLAAAGSTYLALGDSYTIGEGVVAKERWCEQLAQAAGLAPPTIIARTGWTTEELQQAIRAAAPRKTYALVSLQIGVNNQFRQLAPAAYRTEFRELLQMARSLAGNRPGRVFVLSIPDWSCSPYGQDYDQPRIAREIDQFNAIAREECQKAGIAFVDITALTRAAAGDASQFTPDGLHYSGRQMQLWAQQALPIVRNALK